MFRWPRLHPTFCAHRALPNLAQLEMPRYVLGDKPPTITPDKGSGAWCSAPQTMVYGMYKRLIEQAMDVESIQLEVGPEAVAHMKHYLGNTGADLHVDMDAVMRKAEALPRLLEKEVSEAKELAQTLPPGTHSITSANAGRHDFNKVIERHLYFAIGGYSYWGQGTVVVDQLSPATRRFTLDFSFHLYDRYNWDTGKAVKILRHIEIPDHSLQELHRRCYAREYNIRGVIKKQFVWEAPFAIEPPASTRRSPFDILTSPAVPKAAVGSP
jgi:hypothetical protein